MSTVHALADSWNLIDFWPVLKLGDPFPWVLWAIGEENVFCIDLVSSVCINCDLDSVSQGCHIQIWEYVLALFQPVILVYWFVSDIVFLGGSLEKTELITVLVGPLTTCFVKIYGCAEKWIIVSNIIAFRSIASLYLSLANFIKSLRRVHLCILLYWFTPCWGMTILNFSTCEISKPIKKISFWHAIS